MSSRRCSLRFSNFRVCVRAFCLLAILLGPLPGNALAASYRSTDALTNFWDTSGDATRGWANATGGSGVRNQPGAGTNVYLDSSVSSTFLDLGTGTLNNLTGLWITGDGWGLTGANTLTVNRLDLQTPGGVFTLTGGVELNAVTIDIKSGTLKVEDAILNGGTSNTDNIIVQQSGAVLDLTGSTTQSVLTGNHLTVRTGGSYLDDSKSEVNLTGTAHFNEDTTINSGNFTAGGLTVMAGKTLTLGNGANVTSSGDSTLSGDIVLGNAALNGAKMTFNGMYGDGAGSRVNLTGAAEFANTTTQYVINGDFSSVGMTVNKDAEVNASGTTSLNLGGGDLEMKSGSGVIGSGPADGVTTLNADGKDLNLGKLTLGNNTALAARNLTAGGEYTDSASSTVLLKKDAGQNGGNAVFSNAVEINGNFTAEGSVAFNGGTGGINGHNWINGTFTAAGMTLGSAAKVFAAQPATVLNLSGDLVLHDGTTDVLAAIGNTVLDAHNKSLTALSSLTMGNYSTLIARDVTTSGNIDLSAGVNENIIKTSTLTVNGAYRDGSGSEVTLSNAAVFNGGVGATSGDVNIIRGGFETVDMTLGSKAKVNAANARILNVNGDLVLLDGADGSAAGRTMLNAGDKDLTALSSLTMGDYSALIARDVTTSGNIDLSAGVNEKSINARNLTANGIYKDAAGSSVTLDGVATFNGTVNPATGLADTHSINGNFTANGMSIGRDAAVDAASASALKLRGDLDLQAGSGLPGSGPRNGFTTFDAGGKDITELAALRMGDHTRLTARDIAVSGVVDISDGGSGVIENLLSARNITVGGNYTDGIGSKVNLSGIATFLGNADINAGGQGYFHTHGMTIGPDASVNVADYSSLNLNDGPLILRARASLGGLGDLRLGISPVDIDLNRDPAVPAISASGRLVLSNNALTLRHTGTTPISDSWVLVQAGNGVDGSFAGPTIATASLQGTLVQETDRVLFQGSYSPLSSSGMSFIPAQQPNARRAAAGFADLYDNRRTSFMYAVDAAYKNHAGLQADLVKNLRGMTAEGALNQVLRAQRVHDSVAAAALSHAFGNEAPFSNQGIVPSIQSSFQEAGALNSLSRTPRQAMSMAARPEFAGNGDLLITKQPSMPQGYSVLTAWRPASKRNAGLAASANPALGMDIPDNSPGIKAWGGYMGDFSTRQANDGYTGYSAEHHGFLMGASVNVNELWAVGAYGGWSNGNTTSNGIKSDIDSGAAHFGIFGRYRDPGGLIVSGDVAYSIVTNDSRRRVPLSFGSQEMTASYGQQIIGAGLEAAYEWMPENDPATNITPFAAMRYSHLHQDDYREKGTLPLNVGDVDSDAFTTTLGVRAARDFNLSGTVVLTPRASVAWQHNWADNYASARSSFVGSPLSFETRSAEQDRDAAQVGASLDLRVKQGSWDFGMKTAYGVDMRNAGTDHTLYGGLEVKF